MDEAIHGLHRVVVQEVWRFLWLLGGLVHVIEAQPLVLLAAVRIVVVVVIAACRDTLERLVMEIKVLFLLLAGDA